MGRIEMVAETGSYIDAPFHRSAEGADLAELRLECVADVDAVVVRAAARAGRAIGPELLESDLRGKAVLVHTGWDAHWRTDRYFEGYPFLTRAAAEWLGEARAALAGADSGNICDAADRSWPATRLLPG